MVIEGSTITALSRPVSKPVQAISEARADYDTKSVLKCVTAWLEAVRRQSEHTFKSYSSSVSIFLRCLQERQGQKCPGLAEALRRCQPSDVSAWLTIQGGKQSTRAQRLACLRSMFKALVADGILEKNPAREISIPKGLDRETEHHKAVGAGILIRVLKALPDSPIGKRDRAMILLMANNGLRRSEVAGLRLSDLQLNDDQPKIRVRGKGRRIDWLPLRKRTVEAVQAWLQVRDETVEANGPLFHTMARGRAKLKYTGLSPGGVYRAVKRYFPKNSPHGLRSRCLTDTYLRADGNLEMARIVARHVSESTTRRYIKANVTEQAFVHAPDYS